jgi:hypothetical protein
MRFSLRTLLIALALLPPVGAIGYRRWQDGIWEAHAAAKQRRDLALAKWRMAHWHSDNFPSPASAAEEKKAQQRYVAARKDVDAAIHAIRVRYWTYEALSQAVQSRRKR